MLLTIIFIIIAIYVISLLTASGRTQALLSMVFFSLALLFVFSHSTKAGWTSVGITVFFVGLAIFSEWLEDRKVRVQAEEFKLQDE